MAHFDVFFASKIDHFLPVVRTQAFRLGAQTRLIVAIIIDGMAKRHLGIFTALAIYLLSALAMASASSDNISQSYQASTSIRNGSIVSLDPGRPGYVQLADIDNGSRLLGVAVGVNDSLLAVDSGPGKVQVATSGDALTMVSTLDGNIGVGDQVAVSPFGGIGMKALPGSQIIGLAQTAFSGGADAISRQVTDRQGHTSTIKVGYVRVSIAIGSSTLDPNANLNSLQRIARGVSGRTVSTFRVIVSLGVAMIGIVTLITLIYASIYGSIIATGRNPLAREAIFHTLLSVVGLATLTALLSGFTIFLLLK